MLRTFSYSTYVPQTMLLAPTGIDDDDDNNNTQVYGAVIMLGYFHSLNA